MVARRSVPVGFERGEDPFATRGTVPGRSRDGPPQGRELLSHAHGRLQVGERTLTPRDGVVATEREPAERAFDVRWRRWLVGWTRGWGVARGVGNGHGPTWPRSPTRSYSMARQ